MRNLELILNKLLIDEKHQTRVSLLLELISDAYANDDKEMQRIFCESMLEMVEGDKTLYILFLVMSDFSLVLHS